MNTNTTKNEIENWARIALEYAREPEAAITYTVIQRYEDDPSLNKCRRLTEVEFCAEFLLIAPMALLARPADSFKVNLSIDLYRLIVEKDF